MSPGSPKLARRERAIEATRRRLQRLEIETHRIKAELARLEADYEEDVADWLSRRLRRRTTAGQSPSPSQSQRSDVDHAANGTARASGLRFTTQSAVAARRRRRASPAASPACRNGPQIVAEHDAPVARDEKVHRKRGITSYRKSAPPLVLSLALHAVALVLCLSFTYATLVQQGPTLLASPTDLHRETDELFSDIELQQVRFDDVEWQSPVQEAQDRSISDSLFRDLDEVALAIGSEDLGQVGQLDALPTDLATLMSGAGDSGDAAPGGPAGAALFFGARAQGDRFVFVVDNSRSMRDGRFDAAMVELVRTIDALSPRQSFYVIFVSDKPYPMFYPEVAPALIPATPPNKKRLGEWLPKAMLADGRNRELPKAFEMAAALEPHAVFLLWDSDWRYHEPARAEVMAQLARPNQWNFAVHTVGLGTSSRNAGYYLSAIADAHGGMYRAIDVPRRPTR